MFCLISKAALYILTYSAIVILWGWEYCDGVSCQFRDVYSYHDMNTDTKNCLLIPVLFDTLIVFTLYKWHKILQMLPGPERCPVTQLLKLVKQTGVGAEGYQTHCLIFIEFYACKGFMRLLMLPPSHKTTL